MLDWCFYQLKMWHSWVNVLPFYSNFRLFKLKKKNHGALFNKVIPLKIFFFSSIVYIFVKVILLTLKINRREKKQQILQSILFILPYDFS